MTKIKICGITNEKDALWAASLGIDYLGMNFYKDSPRKVSAQTAKKIVDKLPAFTQGVGIFVDEDINSIVKIGKKCRLSFVQLHGNESPQYCDELSSLLAKANGCKIIKAFRIRDEDSLKEIPQYSIEYILLDAFVQGELGGTGETFNWDLAVKAKEFNKPIFLSGGLSVENVKDAIEKVNPYAIDVASGIERLPRRKDYDKMHEFVHKVRQISR